MLLKHRKIIVIAVVCILVLGIGSFLMQYDIHRASLVKATSTTGDNSTADTSTSGFDKKQFSLTDPNSIWIVVNKQRPLSPLTYAPSDLVVPDVALRSNITSTERQIRRPPAAALKRMFADAATSGIKLNLQSGYRSYDFQAALYSSYVKNQGQATADTQSARPGHSEHQTGLAADIGGTSQPICNIANCFADTTEGKWLAEHTYEYGFIIRYTSDKTAVTGYEYEPWHVRYVGKDLARELHNTHTETLEEYFGLGAAKDYQ